MNRNRARRRRGRTRMKAPNANPVENLMVTSVREDTWFGDLGAWDGYHFWRDVYEGPEFVYFVQYFDYATHIQADAIKIGTAKDPVARARELQCGNPGALAINAVILGDARVEKRLHAFWKNAHIQGEWFGGPGASELIMAMAQWIHRQQIERHGLGAHDLEYLIHDVTIEAIEHGNEARGHELWRAT